MAKIVEGPKPKRVTCKACAAVIEYLPEEVKSRSWSYFDEGGITRFVPCPRAGCPGEGVISR